MYCGCALKCRVERDVLKTASRRLLRGCALKGRVERDVLKTASRRLLRGCALKGRVERDVLKTASRRLLRGCALKGRVERDVLKTSPPWAIVLCLGITCRAVKTGVLTSMRFAPMRVAPGASPLYFWTRKKRSRTSVRLRFGYLWERNFYLLSLMVQMLTRFQSASENMLPTPWPSAEMRLAAILYLFTRMVFTASARAAAILALISALPSGEA